MAGYTPDKEAMIALRYTAEAMEGAGMDPFSDTAEEVFRAVFTQHATLKERLTWKIMNELLGTTGRNLRNAAADLQ